MVTDLKCKCKDIFGEFMDKEMEQYVHKLYIHDETMLMTLSIDTPYKACVFIEDANRKNNV